MTFVHHVIHGKLTTAEIWANLYLEVGNQDPQNHKKRKRKEVPLIPTFQIGTWNAWIFMLYELLIIIIFIRVGTARAAGTDQKQPTDLSKAKKLLFSSSKLILLPAGIYSIFLPLKLGTLWFYIGLPITLVGMLTTAIVLIDWARTPTTELITTGLYRYSRNPMYLAMFVFYLGVSIVTGSWIFLLVSVFLIVGCVSFIGLEEQACLK